MKDDPWSRYLAKQHALSRLRLATVREQLEENRRQALMPAPTNHPSPAKAP